MQIDKWKQWSFEAVAREMILEKAPPSFPRVRELRIQILKLHRMIRQNPDKGLLPAGAGRQARKRIGKAAIRVGQQVRKVRAMTDRSFKEWIQPRQGSAGYRAWKNKFDARLAKALRVVARNGATIIPIGRA
jgi:hypothetical protein